MVRGAFAGAALAFLIQIGAMVADCPRAHRFGWAVYEWSRPTSALFWWVEEHIGPHDDCGDYDGERVILYPWIQFAVWSAAIGAGIEAVWPGRRDA